VSSPEATQVIRVPTYQGQLEFRNSRGCDVARCDRYLILHEQGERYVFIKAEGQDRSVYAVDKLAGEVRSMNGAPQFSPDGQYFLSISSFDDGGRFRVEAHFGYPVLFDARLREWVRNDCALIDGLEGWGTASELTEVRRALRRVDAGGWRLAAEGCG
jgi:hypothetical protein